MSVLQLAIDDDDDGITFAIPEGVTNQTSAMPYHVRI